MSASSKPIAVILVSIVAIALVIAAGLGGQWAPQTQSEESGGASFFRLATVDEAKSILAQLGERYEAYRAIIGHPVVIAGESVLEFPMASKSYSETNVQVEGIDEADIVKTDGTYMYIAVNGIYKGGFKHVIYIVKAYPPSDMEIVSTINLSSHIRGLYVYGNKLIALTTRHVFYIMRAEGNVIPPPRIAPPITTIYIYDIADKAMPIKIGEYNVTGVYVSSRLKDGVLYVIAQFMAREKLIELLRELWIPRNVDDIWPPAFIVSIATIDLESLSFKESHYLTGPIDRIYMSHKNLYIISSKEPIYRILIERGIELLSPKLPLEVKAKLNLAKSIQGKMQVIYEWFNSLPIEDRISVVKGVIEGINRTILEQTVIYRIGLDDVHSGRAVVGIVPGRVLEQFAMNEEDGYFIIATTVHRLCVSEKDGTSMPIINRLTENCLYVLRLSDMKIAGSLSGLAKGETVHAARFIGNYVFLVTYRLVDPLYCIDISDPENPKPLGYLKELGYSEYLHPYGDRYLIGIGISTNVEGFPVGLKVSLYDFSNPMNITKISELKLDYRYSEALWTHHAFTMNNVKGYFMFPVKNGVAVIEIKDDAKLGLKGIIEVDHAKRGLYIDDVIYALGSSLIAVDDQTLEPISEIVLTQQYPLSTLRP